jgi:hypothetical protein
VRRYAAVFPAGGSDFHLFKAAGDIVSVSDREIEVLSIE